MWKDFVHSSYWSSFSLSMKIRQISSQVKLVHCFSLDTELACPTEYKI